MEAKVAALDQTALDNLNEDEIAALLEEVENQDALDSKGLRRLVLATEKAITKNTEQRVKYADDPQKFLESETDLDESLQNLQVIAASPDLFPEFCSLGATSSLLQLLAHPNTDIAIDVLRLLAEMCDPSAVLIEDDMDGSAGEMENVALLVQDVVRNSGLQLIVQCFERFNENDDDDREGVVTVYRMIEQMVEVEPRLAMEIGRKTPMLSLLIKRVSQKQFNGEVTLHASEVLAVLLQMDSGNQERVGAEDGINTLLVAIAAYRKTDPRSPEEEEFVQNLFGSVCSCLMHPPNKQRFLKAEGVELMVLLIRKKKFCRVGAPKVLSHALQDNPEICQHFVKIFALKTLFPAFMKQGHKKLKKYGLDERDDEEKIVSILTSLFEQLPEGIELERVRHKFMVDDFAKIDRLVELHEKYMKSFVRADAKIAAKRAQMQAEGTYDETAEEDFFLEKLESGLFTLQLTDAMIGRLVALANKDLNHHIRKQFALQNLSLNQAADMVRMYASEYGEGLEEKDRRRKRSQLISLAESVAGLSKEDNSVPERAADNRTEKRERNTAESGDEREENGSNAEKRRRTDT